MWAIPYDAALAHTHTHTHTHTYTDLPVARYSGVGGGGCKPHREKYAPAYATPSYHLWCPVLFLTSLLYVVSLLPVSIPTCAFHSYSSPPMPPLSQMGKRPSSQWTCPLSLRTTSSSEQTIAGEIHILGQVHSKRHMLSKLAFQTLTLATIKVLLINNLIME